MDSTQELGSIQEVKVFDAILARKEGLKHIIPTLSKYFLVHDRIPSIIHMDKKYESFKGDILNKEDFENRIDIDTCDPAFITNYVVILVGKIPSGFPTVKFRLILNANFFSHTELIFKLTNGKIQFSAYELIGDIIHLNLTEEQQNYKQIIAEAIFFKTGKTVINKTGKIEDHFRFYHSEVLAGPRKLTTVHKENNIRFFLDLGKVYWCSRLQSERENFLKIIKKNEVICDPFCGAGPQVIPAIKKGAMALCNDLNPDAIRCLRRSLELNKLTCEYIENMDAAEFLTKYSNHHVDHFIFNLPELSLDFIKCTEQFKGKFRLHIFFFCKETDDCAEMIRNRTGYSVKRSWLREVRKVSPSKSVYKLEVDSADFFNF